MLYANIKEEREGEREKKRKKREIPVKEDKNIRCVQSLEHVHIKPFHTTV